MVGAFRKLTEAIRGDDGRGLVQGYLRPIDTDEVARKLRIDAEGAERGSREQPSSDAQSLDAVEQKIIQILESEWTYHGSELINNLRGYDRYRATIAEPAIPSETPPSDTDLIDAHQEIKELDRKISATLKQHGDDAAERPDYLKLEDERFEAIGRVISTPARDGRGITAKASVLKMREVLEDPARIVALAESLADDVLRL